jgi:death-on-curing protein
VSEPLWLESRLIVDIHAEQLALFGGPSGIRDPGLLESALARPLSKWAKGETDLPALAAAYAYGLAKNHPFVDGNKRIAFLAMMIFLRLNGIPFQPQPLLATAIMIEVAAGAVREDGLARWIRDQWPHP